MPEVKKGQSSDWPFQYTYTNLPRDLWVRIDPEPVRAPDLVVWNDTLAEQLGLDRWAADAETRAGVLRDLITGHAEAAAATKSRRWLPRQWRGRWASPAATRAPVRLPR